MKGSSQEVDKDNESLFIRAWHFPEIQYYFSYDCQIFQHSTGIFDFS